MKIRKREGHSERMFSEEEVKSIITLDKLTDLYISLYGFALNSRLMEVRDYWHKLSANVQADHYSPAALYYSTDPVQELNRHSERIFSGQYEHFLIKTNLILFREWL